MAVMSKRIHERLVKPTVGERASVYKATGYVVGSYANRKISDLYDLANEARRDFPKLTDDAITIGFITAPNSMMGQPLVSFPLTTEEVSGSPAEYGICIELDFMTT